MPAISTNSKISYSLMLTHESARLIREGLETLPNEKKRNIVYNSIIKDLDKVIIIMDRVLKNELIIQEQKREKNKKKPKKISQVPEPSFSIHPIPEKKLS